MDALDTGRIETGKGNGEAVPELLLELLHHAFGGDHQNATCPAPPDQFSGQNACLQRFAQTHGIGNQQARAKLFQHSEGWLQLEVHDIHDSLMPHHQCIALNG